MFTFILLTIITACMLLVILTLLGIGGTVFLVFAADLIVALGIIWLIYKVVTRKRK